MADIYMHSRLAEDVINELHEELNEKLVFTGAQGPDPMYYMVFSNEAKRYRYYADRLHDTSTRNTLTALTNYTKDHLNQEILSYYIGFICHYALDVKIHPYVYHNVGVYNVNDPSTYSYRGLHLKFERSIDVALIKKETAKTSRHIKLYKKHFPLRTVPKEVADLIGFVLKNNFDVEDGASMFENSVTAMYQNVKRFVSDKYGIKKVFYKIADLFNKGDLFYSDLSMFKSAKKYDYLNLKKRPWHHPVTNEEHTESVLELYDQAKTMALDILGKTIPYIKQNKTIDLDTVFTNLSFNSGVACDHKDSMKYFNIYLQKQL